MRIDPGFILREVAGEFILIPTGEAARNLSGLIALNSTGKFLVDLLKNDISQENLVTEMLNTYDVDKKTAEEDIIYFTSLLRENKMLIE